RLGFNCILHRLRDGSGRAVIEAYSHGDTSESERNSSPVAAAGCSKPPPQRLPSLPPLADTDFHKCELRGKRHSMGYEIAIADCGPLIVFDHQSREILSLRKPLIDTSMKQKRI